MNDLIHLLQNVFESNWHGLGSTNTRSREKWKKMRRTKKPAREIMVVVTMRAKKTAREGRGRPTYRLHSTRQ